MDGEMMGLSEIGHRLKPNLFLWIILMGDHRYDFFVTINERLETLIADVMVGKDRDLHLANGKWRIANGGEGGLFAICYLLPDFLDHISRPSTHFHVNPADIFSYQAQGEDLEADKEKQNRKEGENPFYFRAN